MIKNPKQRKVAGASPAGSTGVFMSSVDVLIEMPKGESRRIHLGRMGDEGWIDLGPIKKIIPINDGIIPIAYGFIMGTKMKEKGSTMEEELDALVYSNKAFQIGEVVRARPTALLTLENGDDKVVCVDYNIPIIGFNQIPEKDLILKYFGYKSKITRIGTAGDAEKLISMYKTDYPLTVPKEVKLKRIA